MEDGFIKGFLLFPVTLAHIDKVTPEFAFFDELLIEVCDGSEGKSRIYMWNTIALGIILLSEMCIRDRLLSYHALVFV